MRPVDLLPDFNCNDPYPAPIPRQQMTAGDAGLIALALIVGWLALVGLCTVVMWSLG